MAARLNIDFETRSTVDLSKTTVYQYAEDPTTDLWCACYVFDDDEDVQVWLPDMPVPARIAQHIEAGGEVRAWNANFERVVWAMILTPRYGWPRPKREQFFCTMAEACAMGLPRSLWNAAKVLNVEHQKQDNRIAKRMSKPRSTKGGEIVWWDQPEHIETLIEYCKGDVLAERDCFYRTRRLVPREREVYLQDQIMNDRGVMLDVKLVRAAKRMANVVRQQAADTICELTDAAVTKVTQYGRLKKWLHVNGVEVVDTSKSTVRDLLADMGVQGPVRRVLEIWADTAKSSIAKLDAMLRMRNSDDVVRGGQIYHGASTGRWSGAAFQPHNFPRGDVKNVEQYIPHVLSGNVAAIEEAGEMPVPVIVSLLRGMIVARPGNRLMVADFAQIEARVLCWLAEQDDMVAEFAAGSKIYEKMGAFIYGKRVDEIENPSFERTIGKNAVLGCGYQMGPEKFQRMVYESTGIKIEDDEAQRAITGYREMNYMVVQFWDRINSAAMLATRMPGKTVRCGRGGMVRFTKRGKILWCMLPSNRPIGYVLPSIEPHESPRGTRWRDALHYWTRDPMTRKWVKTVTYGGKLTENVVQAIARDLLAEGMLRVEAAGYPVVLTVHDEIVADVPLSHGTIEEYNALMAETPPWARSCPVKVEGFEVERYRK